ncbi:hypothetical protein [Moraxella lacunata]
MASTKMASSFFCLFNCPFRLSAWAVCVVMIDLLIFKVNFI